MSRRALVIADELLVLRHSLEAVRQLIGDEARTTWSSQVAALVDLVIERLRLMERAARGSIDPQLLVGTHNEDIGGEGGALLPSWDAADQKREAERVLRRLDAATRQRRRRR